LQEGIRRLADAWAECDPAAAHRMGSVLSVSV